MELHAYIRDTLISICEGINAANCHYENPPPFKLLGNDTGTIDFEIYVSVDEKKSGDASASIGAKGLSFLKVSAGGSKKNVKERKDKHLIKFRIRPDERRIYKLMEGKEDKVL